MTGAFLLLLLYATEYLYTVNDSKVFKNTRCPNIEALANSPGPDQTAPGQEQSDQGLHCLLFETTLTRPTFCMLGNFVYFLSSADFFNVYI